MLLSNASMEERFFLESLLKDNSEEEKVEFLTNYNIQRKDPHLILVCTLIGFLGVAGIQRFITDDTLMGLLYLLTGGFCAIGTIIDAIRYKSITFEYNRKMAQMVYQYTIGPK
jgi:TM2 domain-containing membrane protein YozV